APDTWLVVCECETRRMIADCIGTNFFGRKFHRLHLVGFCFGNVPVLAEEASQVAPCSSHGKNRGARIKVAERFLFDRIDLNCSRMSVTERYKLASFVFENEAKSGLSLSHFAITRTQIAADTPIIYFFPPKCFLHK